MATVKGGCVLAGGGHERDETLRYFGGGICSVSEVGWSKGYLGLIWKAWEVQLALCEPTASPSWSCLSRGVHFSFRNCLALSVCLSVRMGVPAEDRFCQWREDEGLEFQNKALDRVLDSMLKVYSKRIGGTRKWI